MSLHVLIPAEDGGPVSLTFLSKSRIFILFLYATLWLEYIWNWFHTGQSEKRHLCLRRTLNMCLNRWMNWGNSKSIRPTYRYRIMEIFSYEFKVCLRCALWSLIEQIKWTIESVCIFALVIISRVFCSCNYLFQATCSQGQTICWRRIWKKCA